MGNIFFLVGQKRSCNYHRFVKKVRGRAPETPSFFPPLLWFSEKLVAMSGVTFWNDIEKLKNIDVNRGIVQNTFYAVVAPHIEVWNHILQCKFTPECEVIG